MIDSIKQKLEKLNPSKPTNLKKAGVLIAILNYDEYIDSPSIIYTQRSSIVSTHSGEVSFPGGMMEDIDTDLYQTALRESHEEMNLDPTIVTRIGRLNFLISRYDIEVNPFVAVIDEKPNLEPNANSPMSVDGPSAMTSPFDTVCPTTTRGVWFIHVFWFER